MTNKLEVRIINTIPVGAEVVIRRPKISGTVHGLAIYLSGNVSYEVIYWFDSERKSIWVNEREIDIVDGYMKTMGFSFKSTTEEQDHG